MGLQLVASRVLAPFFGNSILVWASLITTFLAAFSVGSFIGASISSKPLATQKKAVGGLMSICCVTLLIDSLACYQLCDWMDLHIVNLLIKLIGSCLLLYFIPVATLSTLTPVCIGYYDRVGRSAGRSAGLLNGVSTLGNIVGVLTAALLLIPTFGIHSLLQVWWISAVIFQTSLWFVLFSHSARSSLPVPASASGR